MPDCSLAAVVNSNHSSGKIARIFLLAIPSQTHPRRSTAQAGNMDPEGRLLPDLMFGVEARPKRAIPSSDLCGSVNVFLLCHHGASLWQMSFAFLH
ncbi:hypothetical protein L209DRAFT_749855, partial [Thermothelomyces heterothallicus CBS 203.75]